MCFSGDCVVYLFLIRVLAGGATSSSRAESSQGLDHHTYCEFGQANRTRSVDALTQIHLPSLTRNKPCLEMRYRPLLVHEVIVKIGNMVRIWTNDVDAYSRERIIGEVGCGEALGSKHVEVVAKQSRDQLN